MGLTTRTSDLSRYKDVSAIAVHPHKGVTRKRCRRKLVPSHNHPSVQSSGEGHRDWLPTIEVPRQVLRENSAEFLVVRFGFQRGLLFQFTGPEVRSFLHDGPVLENPRGCCRQHVDIVEQRSVLQYTAPAHNLPQSPKIPPPNPQTHSNNP